MLNALRTGAGSWIAKIFLGLLVVSFGLWGVGDYLGAPVNIEVAAVGSAVITEQEFERALNLEIRRLQRNTGQVLTRGQAAAIGLDRQVLDGIIAGLLIDQAALGLRLGVTDELIAGNVRQDPSLRNDLGEFDQFRLQQLLAENNLSEQGFVELSRRNLVRSQLVGTIVGGLDNAPGTLVGRLSQYRQETRIASYLSVPDSRVTLETTPDDDALRTYQDNFAARYTAPEYRTLSYLTLAPADLADQVVVTEAAIQDEYDARLDEFTQPERRTIDQLVFAKKADAERGFERIQAGESINLVGADMLQVSAEDIRLGAVTRDELPATLAEVAFGGAGGTPRPVQSDFGWHVLQISEIQPGGQQTLDQVREQLRTELAVALAGDEIFALANTMEDLFAGGATLAEAAATVGRTTRQIDLVDSRGRDGSGTVVADLPRQPEFLRTAFAALPGDDLTLSESEDGSYFVVQVMSVTEPALKPLETIRETVLADWQRDQRREQNSAFAITLVERLNNGVSLASLADELGGLPIAETAALTRNGGRSILPASLVSQLFDADLNGAATAANVLDESQVVAVVKSIAAADMVSDNPQTDRLRATLARGFSADLLSQYQSALRQAVGVDIDDGALSLLNDRYGS